MCGKPRSTGGNCPGQIAKEISRFYLLASLTNTYRALKAIEIQI